MSSKISTPLYFGYVMIGIAVFLTFPAVGDMIESQSLDLWNQKVASMGILYTVGSLFWSFSAFILALFLISYGINVIHKHDKSTPD